MPTRKRFGVHHHQDIFSSIRKQEFNSYTSSYLNVSTSSEGSPERAKDAVTPEKARHAMSQHRVAVLPHEPDTEEVISKKANIEDGNEQRSSTDDESRPPPKLQLARNSTLNAGGKAVENVTFGSIHISSIAVTQEWTSTPVDCDSTKTLSSDSATEDSRSDELSAGDRVQSPHQPLRARRVPMEAIEEQETQLSEVVLHLPDQVEEVRVPRVITSSGRELQRTLSPIDISSIAACGEGDDSSGLAFRPPSRLVRSSELLSPLVLVDASCQRPERVDASCGPEEELVYETAASRSMQCSEHEDAGLEYGEAVSMSIQIGSVCVPKRSVHLTNSWSQTSEAVVLRHLPDIPARQTFVPLANRSAEEQEMVAEVKAWLKTIPETVNDRSQSA